MCVKTLFYKKKYIILINNVKQRITVNNNSKLIRFSFHKRVSTLNCIAFYLRLVNLIELRSVQYYLIDH